MGMPTRRALDHELQALKDDLIGMGDMVVEAVEQALNCLTQGDTALAQAVIDGDREVNRRRFRIEEECLNLIATQQPTASDLRRVLTGINVAGDLERMGDLAVNIAERAVDLTQAPPLRPFHDLTTLADLGQAQLQKALDAFVEADVQKAEEVIASDELLDAVYLKLFNELLICMMEDSRAIRRATGLMFAAKHLERFGDHATNLAEQVIYMVRGTDVRHPRSREQAAGGSGEGPTPTGE